jgi:hypothetical protein
MFILLASTMGNVPSAKAWETVSTDRFIQFYMFTLYSPLNGTYNSRFLDLNLSFTVGLGIRYTLYYSLDGKYGDEIPFTVEKANETHVTYSANAFSELPELSIGSHSLTIFIICSGLMRSLPSNNGTVYFTIDTNTSEQFVPQPIADLSPPKIINLYVENQTINQTKTRLYFQIFEPYRIRLVTYCIDGLENKTFSNNTLVGDFEIMHYYNANLTGLTSGYHNITVYAADPAGNTGASDTVIFHVDTPEEKPINSAVNSVLAGFFCVVAVVALGIFVKRKRNHGIVNDISLGKLG